MSEADPRREPDKVDRLRDKVDRLRDKNEQLKTQLERERERHAQTRDGLDRQRARSDAMRDQLERKREERTRVKDDLTELRRSYHLAGAAKKLDLRKLEGFSEIAARTIEFGRTGMSYDRLFTLWQAVRAAPPDLPAIEIGSYRGGSARFIGEAFRAAGSTPRFFVCDTFAGHAETDSAIDIAHRDADKFKVTSAREVEEYLSDYPAVEVVVGDVAETSARFADETFGLVHLDVDVYPATAYCLRFFAPRLADDAVLVIDDYGFVTCPGVKQAADEFVVEFPQFRVWHLQSGQALLSRLTAIPGAEQ